MSGQSKIMRLLFAGLLVALAACAQDAKEIVRTYFERIESHPDRIRNYTYHLRVEDRSYRPLPSREVKEYEYLVQHGKPYVRIIGKNDKPLSQAEFRKEQKKLDQRLASSRAPRGRSFLDRYEFRLDRIERLEDGPAWVVDGTSRQRGTLSHVKLWIDQADYECPRFEYDVSFSLGGGNTQAVFEQARVEEGVWLPTHSLTQFQSWAAKFEIEVTYSNYKKFQAESELVETSR